MPDGVYITMGAVPPPALIDEDAPGRDALLQKLTVSGIKVNVLGQFHITRRMLDNLISVLQMTAIKYDAAVQQVSQAHPENSG